MSLESNQLSKLTQRAAYRADGREHIFPSDSSLDWFIRTHREQLVKDQALLMLNGRLVIDPGAFDKVVLAVGRQQIQAGA